MDPTTLTDEELDQLWAAVRAEVSRRHTLADAPNKIREINQQVYAASGLQPDDEWSEQMRAAGGYPAGARLVRNGQRFESLRDGNVIEPSTDPQAKRWWKTVT